MNSYIDAQIRNMTAMIRVFEQSCEMGARKDDGEISPDEQKILKAIHKASAKYQD